jgi:hypothetical protein
MTIGSHFHLSDLTSPAVKIGQNGSDQKKPEHYASDRGSDGNNYARGFTVGDIFFSSRRADFLELGGARSLHYQITQGRRPSPRI